MIASRVRDAISSPRNIAALFWARPTVRRTLGLHVRMLFEQIRSIWLPTTAVYYAVNASSAVLGVVCALRFGLASGVLFSWFASISAFVALRRAEEIYLHLSADDIDDRRASVPFAFQSVAAPAICAGVWALQFVILTDFSTETASR